MRRPVRPRISSKLRTLTPRVDRLEGRELLSTTPGLGPAPASPSGFVARPMFEARPLVAYTSPPAGAYTPSQVQQGYGFNKIAFGGVRGDGTGQTIAIVDAYDDPNIQADLNTFSAQFGLPATTITRVNQAGGASYPATDSTGGWELETALDVEWAHAIAPGARILLVEAASASDADLLPAVDYAAAHANVVSMSWGGGEFSVENSSTYEAHFRHSGVAFVASSGDNGAPVSWPAASPNVVAVGGTALTLGAGGTWSGETGWGGSGGGPSAYEAQPSYQAGIVTQTTMRANPDVAYDADPNTGFATYDSFNYNGTSYGWLQMGGTSAGAPQWAALLAIADQGRALNGLPALDGSTPQDVQATLYRNATSGAFHDITAGTSTGSPSYAAGPGYDFVTGLGSPQADLVVQALVGTAPAPAGSDTLAIAAPTADTAGTAFSVTVTARNAAGATDAGYAGTIHLSSSDAQAGLPANYTFTAADKGTHTFSVTLKTAGRQSLTATDTANGAVTGTLSGIAVSPAAASQLLLTGLPASATAGASQTFTVTARDAYGNVATGYAGTVRFSSSDAQAGLPATYTFAAADQGSHGVSITFGTAGSQSVTVTDTASGLSATQAGIAVAPAAPINLAAQAASSTQVNLSWTGSAGATSYLIERSSGGSGWTQVASTPAGTTSYQDTGLAAGTTYSYRVRAAGGNATSAYSNTASATTPAAAGTTNTLWSNSFTPSENSYSWGSYELGVKFRADVSGTVTGVRFYKQTWMGGYTHVGHLWSSSGQLLATATFTNESSYGWQQVNFSSPVAIAANTVYIVSFSTGGGYFGLTTNYFSGAGVDRGPLHALADGASGGDGVYQSAGSFPNVGGSGMNFWVDVAFAPSASPMSAPAVLSSASPVNDGGHAPARTPFGIAGAGGSIVIVPLVTADSRTGPSGLAASSPGTPAAGQDVAVITQGSWPYRRTVPQAQVLASARRGWARSFGPFDLLNG